MKADISAALMGGVLIGVSVLILIYVLAKNKDQKGAGARKTAFIWLSFGMGIFLALLFFR